MSVKSKSAGKSTKKSSSKQSDLFHLAEDIILNVGVGIYIVQLGKFVYVSPLFQKLSGYSDTDIIGTNSLDYIYPDDREIVREKAIKSLKGESPDSYEYRFIRKNGEVMWVLEMVGSILYWGKRGTLGSFMDITEHKLMEEALQRSEERYRTVIEEIDEGYYEVDLDGNFTFVNDSMCRLLKYPKKELIGMNYQGYTPKEQLEDVFKTWHKVYETGEIVRWYPLVNITKDGKHLFVEDSISPLRNKEGKITSFRGIVRDVTERKRMEEELRQSEERYRTIIEEMEEWYFETDLDGNILFFNDAFARDLGYSAKELTKLNFRAIAKQEDAALAYKLFHHVYKTGEPTKNFPHEFVRPDGKITFAEFSIFPKRDQNGKVFGFRGVGHDITERKRTEQQLSHMATHDPLTALPNRMLFIDRLKMALAQAKRNRHKLAVMMLDLDNFKNINDTLGHLVGDQLLKEIGRRLTSLLRQNDTIARLGGDEFTILLPEIGRNEDAVEVAGKILSAFQRPFTCDSHKLSSSTSIGIAIYPDDCQDTDSLLKNADMAMYFVKAQGRNNYQFFANAKVD